MPIPSDLGPLIRDAVSGSPSELYRLGRQGGEGAWFALAAAADEAGHTALSRELRIRSAENKGAPFGTRSLTSLLIDDPGALRNPLKALKKAEKRYGPDEKLRQARISVLASEGRERALAAELEAFRGEPWEAPVLAAVLRRGDESPETIAILERFVLHCSDPSALALLPLEFVGALSPAYRRLLDARLSYALGEERAALDAYRDWLTASAAPEEICDLEAPPPVFAEMAQAARGAELEAVWAELLAGSRRFGALYQAGRLFRELKAYREASSAFIMAAGAVPKGLDRDRAMWFRLKVIYEDYGLTLAEELEAFSWTIETWEDADRFDDRLDEFLHRRVRRGEWDVLERSYRDWGTLWPAGIRARAAWILAFAGYEGRLNGDVTPVEYLETAFEAAPLDWPGLRAAGLLDRSLTPALAVIQPGVESGGEPSADYVPGGQSDDDLIIHLFLRWGLIRRSAEAVLENPQLYSAETIRMTSHALADEDPRVSIRIAGLLWSREDFHPTREDLLLRYPLPFGTLVADIAIGEGLPPEILLGLVRTESAWDIRAVSRSGAQGLAQFMPATWEEWVRRLHLPDDSDPMDPETNLILAAAYLDWLFLREWTFGWTDVLASYNAGGGRIRTWRRDSPGLGDDLFGMSLPVEEPRSYIQKVLSAATIYGYLYAGESPRSLHEEWGLEFIEVN